jgi:hypothetical protein
MALFTVSISNLSPALDHKAQEVQKIAMYLERAAQAVQSAQGNVTSGNILDSNNVLAGTWSYTPHATS